MRLGAAMEPFIKAEYELMTGTPLIQYHGIVMSSDLPWAAASPDFRTKRKPVKLVEGKDSRARRWDSGELPEDVEAQVRWQMGVTGIKEADVAAITLGELRIYSVAWDEATWLNMVTIAEDFRARLAAGGPFSEDRDSIRARYPTDDGSEVAADAEIEEAMLELLRLRALKSEAEEACERIETAVKARMATATRLVGAGWTVTWKRTKDAEMVDWKSIADGLLRQLPEPERTAFVGMHTTVREGFRPFRVVVSKEVTR
jgi:predicted phage-related endonuclease